MSRIELYNNDNIEMMGKYPDNHFDVAIVDPPYGIGKDWKKDKHNVMKAHQSTYKNDSIPSSEYFNELFRVSKKQIIWGGNYFTDFLPPTNNWILWDKKVDYLTQHHSEGEMAWHNFPVPLRIVELIWNGACKCENVTKIHPHQKPVKLYSWILNNYVKKGSLVLDTHMGSGSLAIACYDYGCDFVGIERDNTYFDAALNRINNHKKQLRLDL